MPHRRPHWIWAGRIVFIGIVTALVAYLWVVGLDKADKLASSVAAVLALLALGAPYLLPPPLPGGASATVTDSGDATATKGAVAGVVAGVVTGGVTAEYHEHHHHPPAPPLAWPIQIGQPPALASFPAADSRRRVEPSRLSSRARGLPRPGEQRNSL